MKSKLNEIVQYQSINAFQGMIQTAQHILFLPDILTIIMIMKTNEPLEQVILKAVVEMSVLL